MGILKKFLKIDDAELSAAPATVAAPRPSAPAAPARETARSSPPPFVQSLLVRLLVTEKSSLLQAMNQYVFAVQPRATKLEVARAVEAAYGVRPLAVRVLPVRGKTRVRGRITGRRPDWRKAIVTLPQGKSLRTGEGV